MNLPNKITLTRICMIPVLVAVFYISAIPYRFLISAIVFFVASSTDFLDGYLARKNGQVTNLGKFLDPIADKVLNSTAFILLLTVPTAFCLLGNGGLVAAGILVSVIIARELIVSGFRMIAAGQSVVLAADKIGKLKTVAQDGAIVFLLVSMDFLDCAAGKASAYVGLALFALCAFLTVLSGVNYIVRNRQVLRP